MISILSVIVLIVLAKIAYNYFDKNDKWEDGDQFGDVF